MEELLRQTDSMAPEPDLMVHMDIKQPAVVNSSSSLFVCSSTSFGGRGVCMCAVENGESVRIFEGGRAER